MTDKVSESGLAEALKGSGRERSLIDVALIDWACEGSDYGAETGEDMLRNVIRRLEETDCAGCAAPAGLIYNGDLYDKAAIWGAEIDDALADYEDETGEQPKPRDGSPTIGSLVWFAVEWHAHRLASLIAYENELEPA